MDILTEAQMLRLKVLQNKFDDAIRQRDYNSAKSLFLDIRGILAAESFYTRLCQFKNKLFELAIDMGDFEYAINGLNSNRGKLNKNTRIYIESTALLAIGFIRQDEIEKAKPFIKEVLTNFTVIKSPRTRAIFHEEIINRFNEEAALCSLKGSQDYADNQEIEREVFNIMQHPHIGEQEIFAQIGKSSPKSTKDLIFLVYEFSTKQLPSSERLALPSPDQKIKDEEVGITVFQSVRRVIYNSLCDPNSDIYKTWFNNGMQIVLSKGYITTAIVSCLANLGIGLKMISASIIALIIKFGIEVYCERYKPNSVMQIRGK